MSTFFVEPFSLLIIDGKAVKVERVDGNLFGGFCKCGGLMIQRGWVDESIMISECERCWRVEAFVFNGRRLIERRDVVTVYRQNITEFLREILSPSEFEAIVNRAKNVQYNYNAFSRAKKKLEDLKMSPEEVLRLIGQR